MLFDFVTDISLVMGLICSDMLRSILEFIYPTVTISTGDVAADSTYCQVGGFFTAELFEMSDAMVFIIAIHTAVYVFNPKLTQAADEGGLWRWRYYVFAAWLVIPALLAGLAFINPIAYVPLVTWCYLPARPLVWRYALAWGPRYFILLLISVLYVTLYIYVRRVYRSIDRSQRIGSSGSEFEHPMYGSAESSPNPDRKAPLPVPQPSHISRTRPSIPPPLIEDSEKESRTSTDISFIGTSKLASFSGTPSPASETPASQTPTSQTSTSQTLTSQTPISPQPLPEITPMQESAAARNMSVTTTLNEGLTPSLRNPAPISRDPSQTFAYRRARVERQMRTLFVFPVVYFIMWIPPFINHLYQVITYDSNATTLPPGTFVVTVLATIFLPSQGFVNVCVYAIREQPWRQRKRPHSVQQSNRAGMFGDWHFHSEKTDAADIQAQIDVAKENHKRMSNPVEAAYIRREIERGERELARAQITDPRPIRSNWWDGQNTAQRDTAIDKV
jgi:G protein-coupled receptor GPR1